MLVPLGLIAPRETAQLSPLCLWVLWEQGHSAWFSRRNVKQNG